MNLADPMTLPEPGDYIAGKYRVERVLGMGGMGAVFEVSHRVTQKRFAIKWLLPEHAANDEVAGRLIREAQVAGLFDHPNVVQVYDVGGDHGRTSFIVMELLEGETLADRLAQVGRMSCNEACKILLPCMNALAAAHAKGIIHRDLKPANIFLCLADGREPERAKLLDFGIAKLMPSGSGFDPLRTQTGMIMGTPLYMAPEQMRGRPVDPRVDVYAMGVTLYQLLCGELPFAATTLPELVLKITGEDPEPLDQRIEGLPAGLSALVAHAMARDPQERIPSVDALMRALTPYRDAPTPRATAARPTPTAAGRTKPPPTQLVSESVATHDDRQASTLPRWPWAVAAALCLGVVAFLLLREHSRAASETASTTDAPPESPFAPSTHEPEPSTVRARPRAVDEGQRGFETTSAAATQAPSDPQNVDGAADPAMAVGNAAPSEAREQATTPGAPDALAATATQGTRSTIVPTATLPALQPTAATAAHMATPVEGPVTATSVAPASTTSSAATAAPRTGVVPPSAAPAPAAATQPPAPPEPELEPSPAQPTPSSLPRPRPRFDLDRTDFPGTKPGSAPLERPKTRLGVGEF